MTITMVARASKTKAPVRPAPEGAPRSERSKPERASRTPPRHDEPGRVAAAIVVFSGS
jgi:hypothetical protein